VITTGAPVRDHAWHFVAANRCGNRPATLYHEPRWSNALDPEIAPVTKKLATKLAYTPGTPTVIARLLRQHYRFAAAKASVPPVS